MNLRGPELKMPDMKVPPFLADLYYDLRDRRLLPLIGLVLVAIIAVPFLLGSSPDEVAPATGGGGGATATAGSSELAVVEATPGLREPSKRLKGRNASDPFVQQFTETGANPESGSGATSATSTSSGGSPEEAAPIEIENEEGETVTVRPAPEGGEPAPGTTGPVSPNDPGIHYFGFRPNVRFGLAGSEQLKAYDELAGGTRLPQKKPVAIFLGVSDDGKRATFALTPEVLLVRGKGQCIGGAQNCTFLTLTTGDAVSLLTANQDRTYRLSVSSIKWVEVDPPKPQKPAKSSRRPYLDISQSFSK
jgi:hypothetical protein